MKKLKGVKIQGTPKPPTPHQVDPFLDMLIKLSKRLANSPSLGNTGGTAKDEGQTR